MRSEQILVVQHERCSKIIDRADKSEQRAGDKAGKHERQRDEPPQAKAVTTQILRHFFERRVDVGKRHDAIEQDERKKVQRLDQNDAR